MPEINKTSSHSPDLKGPENNWEKKRFIAKRDFIVRRAVFSFFFLINLGLIGAAIAYTVMYTPFPTTAYLVSPFLAGVLTALIYMGYPTGGVNRLNYQEYTNPATIAGKAMAYLLFGPLMILREHMDWTAYQDSLKAHEIIDLLKNGTYKKISSQYGHHFKNLVKYGLIPKEYKQELVHLYKKYEDVQRGLCNLKKQKVAQKTHLLEKEANAEAEWATLKAKFVRQLPDINPSYLDFASPDGRIRAALRKFFMGYR